MSEEERTILSARVVHIRARLIGNMLIVLSLLFFAGVIYSWTLLPLERAVATLQEALARSSAVPPAEEYSAEQRAAMFAEAEEALGAVREIPLIWAMLVGIAVVGVTIIAIRSIAQPTERLTAAAESLAKGKLEEHVEIEWADEFGRLGTAFNEMADRLRLSYSELEQKVVERTEALERRSNQLEAAARVARDATAIQDVDQLLEETARLISTRFGFYHTGIFLMDEKEEYAVLRAASSEGGQRMLAREHRLRAGETGIVGYVVGWGEPRIALDVGEDAVYFDNPDLPGTRSEAALPLRARGKIIGALDVQSTEPRAFDQDDVIVLQTLADQVAVAIDNAHLFQQLQVSLEAERRAYGELTARAWQEISRAQPGLGYRYDPQGILASGPDEVGRESSASNLAFPLEIRGQVVGILNAYKQPEAGDWGSEEVALLQSLIGQLGIALEGARLYEEAQHRAARDRLMGEVMGRMRETLDMETVLKTTADEMFRILDLDEITVRLVPEDVAGTSHPGGDGARSSVDYGQ